MTAIGAVDIGGTELAVGIVDETGLLNAEIFRSIRKR